MFLNISNNHSLITLMEESTCEQMLCVGWTDGSIFVWVVLEARGDGVLQIKFIAICAGGDMCDFNLNIVVRYVFKPTCRRQDR